LVEVDFQRVGAGFFDQVGESQPSAERRPVEAGDDWYVEFAFGVGDQIKILVWAGVVRFHLGEIVDRFGRRERGEVEHLGEFEFFVNDLFFKDRRQDRGGGAGVAELLQRFELTGQRARGDDERAVEIEREVFC